MRSSPVAPLLTFTSNLGIDGSPRNALMSSAIYSFGPTLEESNSSSLIESAAVLRSTQCTQPSVSQTCPTRALDNPSIERLLKGIKPNQERSRVQSGWFDSGRVQLSSYCCPNINSRAIPMTRETAPRITLISKRRSMMTPRKLRVDGYKDNPDKKIHQLT